MFSVVESNRTSHFFTARLRWRAAYKIRVPIPAFGGRLLSDGGGF
jgi:hypothetical protein